MVDQSPFNVESSSGQPYLPLVSIITVVYNGEQDIEQAVKSVVNQTYQNIEYIVIDGASSDRTMSILERYRANITELISEKDSGIYNAMNKGLALAKGEIIAILNADDYYNDDTIEKVVDHFKETGADVVYGNLIKLRTFNHKDYFKEVEPNLTLMEQTMPIFHPSTFIKKNVYDQIGGYDEKYRLSSDYDLVYRIYKQGFQFSYLPLGLTIFRIGGVSSYSCNSYKEGYQILKSYDSDYQEQMKKLIFKCKMKKLLKTIVFNFVRLFRLEKWNEKRMAKKWR